MYIHRTEVQENNSWMLMKWEALPKGDFSPTATLACGDKTSIGLKDPTQLTAQTSLARYG